MEIQPSLIAAVAAGIALAAASGLRAFLPLLGLGLAARTLGLGLQSGTEWLRSDLALIALGVATVVEIAGDKIPVVDHALDAIGTLLRPAAAAVASYALLETLPGPWDVLLALAFGGGALLVHAAKAKIRIGSTATTLGSANPVLSVFEDTLAVLFVAAAVLVPLAALVAIVLFGLGLRRLLRRRAAARAAAGARAAALPPP